MSQSITPTIGGLYWLRARSGIVAVEVVAVSVSIATVRRDDISHDVHVALLHETWDGCNEAKGPEKPAEVGV